MGLDGTLYDQTGVMIPNCNVETPQVGFFNHNSTSNNGMVMDLNNFGEYQRMMEGEGLTRTYSDTDSMHGAFNNAAEMQVIFTSYFFEIKSVIHAQLLCNTLNFILLATIVRK